MGQPKAKSRAKFLIPWLILLLVVVFVLYDWPKGTGRKAAKKAVTVSQPGKDNPKGSPSPASRTKKIEITVELLNFRARPELANSGVIATLTKGTVAKLVNKSGQWLEIELPDGRKGFISDDKNYYRYLNGRP